MRVLVTGATGFIGRKLCVRLRERGHQLIVLTRSEKKAKDLFGSETEVIEGDLLSGPLYLAGKNIEAVVHLAGDSIAAGRWTSQRKQDIRKSRVLGTENLMRALNLDSQAGPSVIVSANAIGFYGDRGDEVLDENATSGKGFLAQVCKEWESAVASNAKVIRTVILRIGMVIGRGGGALEKMLPPFRIGVGAVFGNGHQWMSWIHLEDLCEIILQAIEKPWSGPVNAVSPGAVTNREFSKALGRALHRPVWIKVPALFLKAALGEMTGVLLGSQRVEPRYIQSQGFEYKYPTIEKALKEAV